MTEDKKHNLSTGDLELIKAAKTGEGTIALTPQILEEITKSLTDRQKYIDETYPELVNACTYETRLAVTAWVMRKIVEHAKEGGSFRYLIYDRLGFGSDAYVPLYNAGGMTISNEFELKDELD